MQLVSKPSDLPHCTRIGRVIYGTARRSPDCSHVLKVRQLCRACAKITHMDNKTLGRRVAQAREAVGMSQGKLAELLEIDRTAVNRAESGERKLAMMEMIAIAEAVGRPLAFFVNEAVPAVVSRRSDSAVAHDTTQVLDMEIELFASDALTLMDMGLIGAVARDKHARTPTDHDEAERLARSVRENAALGDSPLLNLGHTAETLGLYTYAAPLGINGPDGGCVELSADTVTAGVAVVNGDMDSGRRRMTLAHELGHWLCGDAYDDAAGPDSERMMNSFAIHFLAPRSGVTKVWNSHPGWSSRDRALAVGSAYRLSWSATVLHLRNLGFLQYDESRWLSESEPRTGDYVRLELSWDREPKSPYLSPAFAAACVEGYTSGRLTAARTLELLRGTITRDELPEEAVRSLDSLRRSFARHSD